MFSTWLVSSRAASTSSSRHNGGRWCEDRASTSASPSRACCPPLSSWGERSTTAEVPEELVIEAVVVAFREDSFLTIRRKPSSSYKTRKVRDERAENWSNKNVFQPLDNMSLDGGALYNAEDSNSAVNDVRSESHKKNPASRQYGPV